eukprot:TRINITY_DN1471_c0_g1_i1.p1 TRINITY_DN1471_c0_g1~~TRINITY_DN1471_c0_g1_i1.p1  ORF type:complete len:487 (+),score=122.35 TRINITY_DN1471_c0_g1_i1:299-1759(+)
MEGTPFDTKWQEIKSQRDLKVWDFCDPIIPFGDAELEIVGAALAENSVVKTLNLEGRRIGDSGLKILTPHILHNTSITTLNLHLNALTPASADDIFRIAIHRPTEINILYIDHDDVEHKNDTKISVDVMKAIKTITRLIQKSSKVEERIRVLLNLGAGVETREIVTALRSEIDDLKQKKQLLQDENDALKNLILGDLSALPPPELFTFERIASDSVTIGARCDEMFSLGNIMFHCTFGDERGSGIIRFIRSEEQFPKEYEELHGKRFDFVQKVFGVVENAHEIPIPDGSIIGAGSFFALILEPPPEGFELLSTYIQSTLIHRPEEGRKIVSAILSKMVELEQGNFIYTCLNSRNIFVSSVEQEIVDVFFCEVGIMSARVLHDDRIRYLSPSVIRCGGTCFGTWIPREIDTWAFGMLTYEIMSTQVPFHKFSVPESIAFAICEYNDGKGEFKHDDVSRMESDVKIIIDACAMDTFFLTLQTYFDECR